MAPLIGRWFYAERSELAVSISPLLPPFPLVPCGFQRQRCHCASISRAANSNGDDHDSNRLLLLARVPGSWFRIWIRIRARSSKSAARRCSGARDPKKTGFRSIGPVCWGRANMAAPLAIMSHRGPANPVDMRAVCLLLRLPQGNQLGSRST